MTTAFSAKDPDEEIYYGIDFAPLLDIGETVSSATTSIRVISGTDAAPSGMLSGAPIIAGSIVNQLIVGGIAGSNYKVGISITTSIGQVFTESAELSIAEKD